MSTGELHVVHVDDEEDGRTVLSCFGEEAVVLIALGEAKRLDEVLIALGEADRLDEIVELLVPLSGCLFQAV